MNYRITLAEDGIFPIVYDAQGNKLKEMPRTGYLFPGTLQGEGKLNGMPSLFIRLAGCNLRCIWSLPDGNISACDTFYASFDTNTSFVMDVDDIVATVANNTQNLNHIVITGGEPLIVKRQLRSLLEKLKDKKDYHITIETNGTIYNESIIDLVNLVSISPKLSNSVPHIDKLKMLKNTKENDIYEYHEQRRINIPTLQAIIDHCVRDNNKSFQLKFVISIKEDILEIEKDILSKLVGWKSDDILLMPLGKNKKELQQNESVVASIATEYGYRYCPRLHIALYGSGKGV